MFWKKFCLTRNKIIFLEFLVELDVLILGIKLNRQPGDWLVIFFTNTIVFLSHRWFCSDSKPFSLKRLFGSTTNDPSYS